MTTNTVANSVPAHHDSKPVELVMTYYGLSDTYQINSIKNSTYYHPGQWMSRDVAIKVCALPNWTVTMVETQFWAHLIGFAESKVP